MQKANKTETKLKPKAKGSSQVTALDSQSSQKVGNSQRNQQSQIFEIPAAIGCYSQSNMSVMSSSQNTQFSNHPFSQGDRYSSPRKHYVPQSSPLGDVQLNWIKSNSKKQTERAEAILAKIELVSGILESQQTAIKMLSDEVTQTSSSPKNQEFPREELVKDIVSQLEVTIRENSKSVEEIKLLVKTESERQLGEFGELQNLVRKCHNDTTDSVSALTAAVHEMRSLVTDAFDIQIMNLDDQRSLMNSVQRSVAVMHYTVNDMQGLLKCSAQERKESRDEEERRKLEEGEDDDGMSWFS